MRTVAGRYAIEGQLGAGSMGEVYRVRHLQLGKSFALKVVAPAHAREPAWRAMFEREVKLASEISHPNIVSITDFGEDAELGAFMVMELVIGELLLDDLATPMSLKRMLDIVGQVADALEHVHRHGIVHGDVKAENIVLAEEPGASDHAARRRRVVRLLDFGLARRLGNADEVASGSPHYLAPECVLGGPPTVASDLYALGVLGFVLLTRTLPFAGDVEEVLAAQVHEPFPSIGSRSTEPVDAAIETLIARATAKRPEDRHASAAAFRYEVNTVMDMLALGRKRNRASGTIRPSHMLRPSGPITIVPKPDPTERAITELFEHSTFPQALITCEGRILLANPAFAKLAGIAHDAEGAWLVETVLGRQIPNIMKTIRRAPVVGQPLERRVTIDRGELVLWAGPTANADQVHVIVRELPHGVASVRDSASSIEQ